MQDANLAATEINKQCAPAPHAGAQESGLLRFLRTSLTSTSRVSRRVGEREGKRSAKSDRLPSHSQPRRDRVLDFCGGTLSAPAELAPPRDTAHLVCRWLKTHDHWTMVQEICRSAHKRHTQQVK
jgi:hypothetical protein